jgi:MscS family membrane protein
VTPVQGLCFAFLVRIGAAWIDPAPKVGLYVTRGLTLISFLSIAWLCMRLLELGTNRLRTAIEARHRTISHSVLPMATRVLKVTILVFAILAVLSSWGYNTSAALAGLGIGGVAIALAAQKTIENVFGGVAVISDRPVHVGDFCRFGESVGTVEDIGLRSTRIRTLDRTLLTVPNAQFSSVALENFSRRDKMLFHIKLNLRRDTSPDQVRTVLDSIRTILTQHPLVESGDLPVRFIGLGTYSLDVEVFVYVKTESGDEYLKIQQELLLRILDAIAAAGTALALPTQASVSYSTPADAAQPNPEREPALSHR